MTLRAIAFWIGFFSFVMGILTYDSAVVTAPIPVISGALVMVLALFKLIPEFKRCCSCNRKILKKTEICPHCQAQQPKEEC
ncbi:MAG: hypothetical protein KQH63_22005 [Desulfobulbaceae bacterium]|nr:hypothetical protein [Desulfobulbaceae bacterium]